MKRGNLVDAHDAGQLGIEGKDAFGIDGTKVREGAYAANVCDWRTEGPSELRTNGSKISDRIES